MKVKLIILICIVAILSGCQGGAESKTSNETQTINQEDTESRSDDTKREDVDFRNAKWGDDIETVKKYEKEIELDGENEVLFGITKINSIDSVACYYFDDGKLYEAGYVFAPQYANEGQYISSYESMKELLIKKYGTPASDEIIPMEEQDMIDYVGPASALNYGYVTYRTMWYDGDTEIGMIMYSENYDVNWGIVYSDKNYEKDIEDYGI